MSDFLIIEDDAATARALGTTLAIQGLGRSDLVGSTQAARDALSDKTYAIVFLDLNLPEPVGEGLLREILDLRPTQAVVVVTGLNDADVAVRCLQRGARDFLTKPCSPARVIAAVARARQSAPVVVADGALPSVDDITDAIILAALERTQGNLTQAASMIGMSRSGLAKRLTKRGDDPA